MPPLDTGLLDVVLLEETTKQLVRSRENDGFDECADDGSMPAIAWSLKGEIL